MPAKKKKLILLAVVAVILLTLIIWTAWGNTALECNTYTVSSSRLPECFDGYRIAQVSDLHNTEMGNDNEKLLEMLQEAAPDMIAITGDLIDSRNTDTKIARRFVQKAAKIAPVYYVTGNHEARTDAYEELKAEMKAAGVILLEDEKAEISLESQTITLIGVNDPSFQTDYLFGDSKTVMNTNLSALHEDKDGFTILLSHRPELFDAYVENDIDLVLCGHAHGGQFRLPFIGGLIAPNQGLFPEYDAGLYKKDNTNMLVSRGIGNSILPFRFNNRPEIILIELNAN